MCKCADVRMCGFLSVATKKSYKSFYFTSLIRKFAHPHICTLKKAAPYIFLAVLLVITLVVSRLRDSGGNEKAPSQSAGRQTAGAAINRDRGFDRRTSMLEYTRHARCRMQCRSITQAEVEGVMKDGRINYRKSNVKANPCPLYAVEGYTADNQHVRVVFAQCNEKTKVVTCIDLDKEWQCDCPGDDK